MKIQVIQREFESHGTYSRSYKICDCKYCCEGIKHLPNVDFYFEATENTDNPIEDEHEEERDLGVMLHKCVTYHDTWYDDYGCDKDYYYKLEYCPICGEKIEVEIVDNVDVTNEYKTLQKERDEVHKKCTKTDSIKKQKEYQRIRQELDAKINALYYTDCLPDRGNEDEDY